MFFHDSQKILFLEATKSENAAEPKNKKILSSFVASKAPSFYMNGMPFYKVNKWFLDSYSDHLMFDQIPQWSRLIMPTLFKWSRGSTDFFSSFRYTFMHYFLYRIGLCFAFFHLKCTETKMAEKLNNFEKVERKKLKFQPCSQPRDLLMTGQMP